MPETHDLPDDARPLDLLGNSAALNVRKARKLATAVTANLDIGINPAAEKRTQRQQARDELTLGELFDQYRHHLIGDQKKGVAGIVWYFERYIGALPTIAQQKHGKRRTKAKGSVNWQHRRLSTIRSDEVERLRATLARNISPTTANRVMELLRAILNFGKRKRLYSGPNHADLPKFKLHSRERRIESHEARSFFETLNAEQDHDFKDYVYLSICAGARRGNLLQMRWNEISLNGATWRVTGEKMKNGDPLVIPLIPKAVEILRRRAESGNGSPWVFPGSSADGHRGPFRFQWERFRKLAQVPDLRIHDLRRTLGSWMSSTGASTVTTMRALGHKTIDAALLYQRLELAPVRDAMDTGILGLLKAAEQHAPGERPEPHKRTHPSRKGSKRAKTPAHKAKAVH
jgi:integrase